MSDSQSSPSVMAMFVAVAAFAALPFALPTAKAIGPTSQAKQEVVSKLVAAAAGGSFTKSQKDEIGLIVREYLIGNPELLIEVTRELEKRQASAQAEQHETFVKSNQAEIFRSGQDFTLGNPSAKLSVVEYFDYNCGWCKRALSEVQKLVETDKDIRVVMKELPIFGADSEFAARAAMASKLQGKYWDFHVALMKERRVTKANTIEIAEKVGLDVAKLKADMEKPEFEATLKANAAAAQALGIEGTPAFIIDSKVNVGYLSADGLAKVVEDVRKSGCKVC